MKHTVSHPICSNLSRSTLSYSNFGGEVYLFENISIRKLGVNPPSANATACSGIEWDQKMWFSLWMALLIAMIQTKTEAMAMPI